jgi:energy-coupling factor transporter ATP-binding protein EcfA2
MAASSEEALASSISNPALVEHFSIEGLYGYRNVSMSASFATTILIAKNGAGKTTLLGALDAFLRCQFSRLSNLQFDRIVCKLRSIPEALVLTSADIEALAVVPPNPELMALARRYAVEPMSLIDFVENEFDPRKTYGDYEDDPVFSKLIAKNDYNMRDFARACEKMLSVFQGRVPAIDAVRAALKNVLSEVEIVYLPTFRRIELSLGEKADETRVSRRKSIQSKLGLPKRGFFNADIQFGLGDISYRLKEMNNRLLFSSNQGYREISARIINDLLDGTFEQEDPSLGDRPDKESLALFFSRLQHGSDFVPHFDRVEIPDIDKIYSEGGSSAASTKFLNYFLSRLNKVILATRAIEGLVENFVDHCNTYLAEPDLSTELRGLDGSNSISLNPRDDKKLVIDRMTLDVQVVSVAAGRTVPMDSLSSGEKQMISLFARLYLYDGPKIVLVDEPELSLSIDWQRKILLDVAGAPTCSQLIAITHSPFVFENALEPFARALSVRINPIAPNPPDIQDLFAVEGGEGDF